MSIKQTILKLADTYASELDRRIKMRADEMQYGDQSHHMIYWALGVSEDEGNLIDVYQNKGRFLYKYAGAFMEEVTLSCFKEKFSDAERIEIENTIGQRPKRFEIDCLIGQDAIEIKWRDATTDGDHITKEHTRIQAIKAHGFKPIRVMFFQPNRAQARRIQTVLKTIYDGVGGEYHAGENAWNYVHVRTGIDLTGILDEIAEINRKRGEK